MNILALQHVEFENVGMIADWAEARGYNITTCKLYENDPLPSHDSFDMLVVMGGPMSVGDEDLYPWLAAETIFIKAAIEAGKYVIGVCLGAQLIASVLGAKVYPNPAKEIGWFPVAIVDAALDHPILRGLNPAMTAFHWHGDTFDMPKGATLLMSSKACKHQAFIYRDKVLGLQFHLEMTEESIQSIIDTCRAEIIPSATVQPEEKLMSGTTNTPACQRVLYTLLDRLVAH